MNESKIPQDLQLIAKAATDAAIDKKAKRLVLLDVNPFSDMCDLQLICSGDNDRQTKAIASAIQKSLAEAGIKPQNTEGQNEGQWILMDYGRFNVHIFFDNLRDYYAIESLWPQAKFLTIDTSEKQKPS